MIQIVRQHFGRHDRLVVVRTDHALERCDDEPFAYVGTFETTVGMPIGVGVILSAVLLTGIYVWRANGEFDRLTREIVEDDQ